MMIDIMSFNFDLPHQHAYQIAQTSSALQQNPQAQRLHPSN